MLWKSISTDIVALRTQLSQAQQVDTPEDTGDPALVSLSSSCVLSQEATMLSFNPQAKDMEDF